MAAIDKLQELTLETFETNFCHVLKTEDEVEIECTITRGGVMLEIIDPTGKLYMRITRDEYIQLHNWISQSEHTIEELKRFINELPSIKEEEL